MFVHFYITSCYIVDFDTMEYVKVQLPVIIGLSMIEPDMAFYVGYT